MKILEIRNENVPVVVAQKFLQIRDPLPKIYKNPQ